VARGRVIETRHEICIDLQWKLWADNCTLKMSMESIGCYGFWRWPSLIWDGGG
jgi:hypothetical protein